MAPWVIIQVKLGLQIGMAHSNALSLFHHGGFKGFPVGRSQKTTLVRAGEDHAHPDFVPIYYNHILNEKWSKEKYSP